MYTHYWKRNLFVIFLSQFLAMVGFGCCMPFIPLLLKNHLHIDNEQLRGLYVSLYSLAGQLSLTVAYPFWGTLADKYGRKIMLLRASYAAGLLYPLLAFAGNFWWLLGIRFFTSFFSGTVNPAQTLLVATTPKDKHGLALGLLSTCIWSGDVTGYLAGGLMVDYFGYKVAFLACGFFYILGGVLVHLFVQENFVPPAPQVATPKVKPAAKHKFRQVATPAVLWVCAFFLLMGIARRIDTPFIAMLVETVNGPDRAATCTGITSAFAAVGGIIAGLVVGRLCDTVAPRKLLLPILISSGLFTLGQAFSSSLHALILCRFLTYMAAAGLQPVLQVMLTKVTAPEKRGTFFGWTASLSTAGGVLCNLLSGALAYYVGVRGVFAAGGITFLLMVPLLIPFLRAYRNEYRAS